MCELLGMSASQPVELCFSWRGFKKRGGENGPHRDGFGIGFYREDGYHDFHDIRAAAESPLAELLGYDPLPARVTLGHLRQASEGSVEIKNTYPFTRYLNERRWCYIMQGQLEGFERLPLTGRFIPMGTTDGEYAFCWLMDQLMNSEAKDVDSRCDMLRNCGDLLAGMGVFNMLLSDGEVLYAYCSKSLHYLTRRSPFGTVTSLDNDEQLDLSLHCNEAIVYTLLATHPLTNEPGWQDMAAGEAIAFRSGMPCAVSAPATTIPS